MTEVDLPTVVAMDAEDCAIDIPHMGRHEVALETWTGWRMILPREAVVDGIGTNRA